MDWLHFVDLGARRSPKTGFGVLVHNGTCSRSLAALHYRRSATTAEDLKRVVRTCYGMIRRSGKCLVGSMSLADQGPFEGKTMKAACTAEGDRMSDPTKEALVSQIILQYEEVR